jgi:hypothetical protein
MCEKDEETHPRGGQEGGGHIIEQGGLLHTLATLRIYKHCCFTWNNLSYIY